MATTLPDSAHTPPLTVDGLLAEPGTEIVEAPSDYPNFDGVVLRRSSGPLQIVLPKGSLAGDRQAVARRLVAQMLGAQMIPLQSGTYGGAR